MCVESEDRSDNNKHELMKWPETDEFYRSSWLQSIKNWTFYYMGAILDKGSERAKSGQRLTNDHLFAVPSRMKSSALSGVFLTEFEAKTGQPRQLLQALWKVASPDFIPAGLCELISLACQISLPLLVRGLLQVLEERPQEKVIKAGFLWSLGIFGCTYSFVALLYLLTRAPGSFFNAFASHRHRHLAMKSGIAMRSATVNVIYRHLLHLSPEGKMGLTSGEITNLVATDTQKLYEVRTLNATNFISHSDDYRLHKMATWCGRYL